MIRRVVTMLMVVGAAIIAFAAVGLATPTPGTPGPGTPAASPEASPSASPMATPEVAGDVKRGESLVIQCLACHTTDGTVKVGPSWKGLYGSKVELEGGETVVADAQYLHRSIVDPMSQIVKGFPPAMPPYNYLPDQDIQDIVAYLMSLK